MIDISLGGLIGAMVGMIVAAFLFVPLVEGTERLLRLRHAVAPGEEPEEATPEQDFALLRRSLLVIDMLACAGVGYWIGQMFGD